MIIKKILILLILVMLMSFNVSAINVIGVGKNLFNSGTVTVGYYCDWTTGNPTVSSTYSYTDYIPVVQNTAYINNKNSRMIAYYNSSKTFISGVQNIDYQASFTTPASTAYMRITFYNTAIAAGSVQIEKGTISTEYVEYYYNYNADYSSYFNDITQQNNVNQAIFGLILAMLFVLVFAVAWSGNHV
jgi:hypothetical protein